MAAALLLCVLSMGAEGPPVQETVDVIELNHFYDDEGRHVFDQVIFYRWNGFRDDVVDWRPVKSAARPHRRGAGWEYLWFDETVGNDVPRQVRAGSYRETWTQFDPEIAEREQLPKELRTLLRRAL